MDFLVVLMGHMSQLLDEFTSSTRPKASPIGWEYALHATCATCWTESRAGLPKFVVGSWRPAASYDVVNRVRWDREFEGPWIPGGTTIVYVSRLHFCCVRSGG